MMPLTLTPTPAPTSTSTATSMAAQSSIHLHFYSRRLTVSACHLLFALRPMAKSLGIECLAARQLAALHHGGGESHCRQAEAPPPRTFAKLLQCRKFLSHVYKKFNACTFHILCAHSIAALYNGLNLFDWYVKNMLGEVL